jgi:hypothetical protein
MNTTTIGTPMLCAWPVAPGFVWVETRSPVFARKLSRRSDARLVVQGVTGGFLRTFEFPHGLSWTRRLIARHQSASRVANEPIPPLDAPPASRKAPGGVLARGETVAPALRGSTVASSGRINPARSPVLQVESRQG